MKRTQVVWDPTPGGNVEHMEEHDLTTDEVDYVLQNYETTASAARASAPASSAIFPMVAILSSSTKSRMTTP